MAVYVGNYIDCLEIGVVVGWVFDCMKLGDFGGELEIEDLFLEVFDFGIVWYYIDLVYMVKV